MSKRVGIIGCGTIGSELAFAVDEGKVKNASIVSLFDEADHAPLSLGSKLRSSNPGTFTDFSKFIAHLLSEIRILLLSLPHRMLLIDLVKK